MDELSSDIYFEISKHLDYSSLYNLKCCNTNINRLISNNELILKIDGVKISSVGTDFAIIKLFSNNLYCDKYITYVKWDTACSIEDFMISNLKQFRNIKQIDIYFNKDPARKNQTYLWEFEIREILLELPISIEVINFYKFFCEGNENVSSYLIKCLSKLQNLKKIGLNKNTQDIFRFRNKYKNINFQYLK